MRYSSYTDNSQIYRLTTNCRRVSPHTMLCSTCAVWALLFSTSLSRGHMWRVIRLSDDVTWTLTSLSRRSLASVINAELIASSHLRPTSVYSAELIMVWSSRRPPTTPVWPALRDVWMSSVDVHVMQRIRRWHTERRGVGRRHIWWRWAVAHLQLHIISK